MLTLCTVDGEVTFVFDRQPVALRSYSVGVSVVHVMIVKGFRVLAQVGAQMPRWFPFQIQGELPLGN
jgi:hypothetical protein